MSRGDDSDDSDFSGELDALSRQVIAGLSAGAKLVSTAESCTGGWIAKALTDVPGSSEVFAYGIVSYSNGAKETLLGVNPETLRAHGAVAETTVREMAEGALQLSGADLSVAVSGIAGPDGGTANKPVGTVCFAWAVRTGTDVQLSTERRLFAGDRDAVRRQTVVRALQGIQDRLRA